ncbi:GNAT family N-acetyltransferase [Maribacter sp. HTCC2170]|uniref:GNAT family N-acetyltransferase n=1 Tax=Maribacter sp. (strain HTCC2170 / KCCM 42371) TaxID=313603 RepID=UPI00006BD5AF|nr:GNAT family protein [Maribacter sp. HTCC2170]EAR02651.1 acetyl transferase [Maribacter sp. HTCC2170]
MILELENYSIEAIAEKDAWRLCDFVVSNEDRLKRYFPKTLEQNLNPTLAANFVAKKARQFIAKEELLYALKHKENRTIIGLVYIKELDWKKKQAELAYCIGYQYEGKGWMSRAVEKLSQYAFENLRLNKLQIIVHNTNIGSIKVAQNNGYIWQRTLKKEHTPPGEDALDMELYELYG